MLCATAVDMPKVQAPGSGRLTVKDAKQVKGGASRLGPSLDAELTARTIAERESPRSAG